MKLTNSQIETHKQMWNKMDLNAMKQFISFLNPKLNIKDVEDNMFWNDLLDLDYDRALIAFSNALNNIY